MGYGAWGVEPGAGLFDLLMVCRSVGVDGRPPGLMVAAAFGRQGGDTPSLHTNPAGQAAHREWQVPSRSQAWLALQKV